jgi:enolase
MSMDYNDRSAAGPTIAAVHARQVLDCHGASTLEVEVSLASGARGRAIVPAGGSTGVNESREWRDHDRRFRGGGVRAAVRYVREEVAAALRGENAADQQGIDRTLIELDGTPDKSRLGSNTLLGASLACAHAAAAHERLPLWRRLAGDDAHVLPVPMVTVLDGGAHARNALDLQEVMVVP